MSLLIITHLLLFAFINFGVFDSGRVLLGIESREQYLSRRLAYYPCALYSSEHLEQNGKILIVGEQRSYYVPPPSIAASIFAPNVIVSAANEAQNSKKLADDLRKQGIDRLLIVPSEMNRLGTAIGHLTPAGDKNFQNMLKNYAKIDYQAPGCTLLSLNPGLATK